jgi:outer membrane protein TolC
MRSGVLAVAVVLSVPLGIQILAIADPDGQAAGQHETHTLTAPRVYEGPPLALATAIQEAMANNPDLLALRSQVDTVRRRPAQEHGLNPPTADATIWQWPINTVNPANTNMYMFTMEQEIPGPGKRDLRAAVAEKDIALADTDVTVRARQVIDEIQHAYAALFIARKAIDIHIASVDLLRQIADVAQEKYTTGRISQQDVLKPVLELSKLHTDIVTFEEQAAIATARLNVSLNRGPDTSIGPLTDPSETLATPPIADLQRLALEHQPELARARLEIDKANAELAVAKGDYKPDFTVEGGYMLLPGTTDAWTGRVGITWPNAPWSRAKLDARVAEQTSAVDVAKARERAAENLVRLAVQEAYARVTSARDRAALFRTTIVPQARQTMEVSRVAYQTDRVDFQTLIDNERALLDAQLDYYRALSDLAMARADLERAVGADLTTSTAIAPREER